MAKTSKQIQSDFLSLLRHSQLAAHLSGGVYRSGLRPRDSKSEDAVVIFTAGYPNEIQTGVVTINIFVPDIDPYENGVMVEDGQRCEEIELLAKTWVESLPSLKTNYQFKLQQVISTEADQDTQQHFVVVKIRYRYFGDDNAVPIFN